MPTKNPDALLARAVPHDDDGRFSIAARKQLAIAAGPTVTNGNQMRRDCRKQPSRFNKINGRHEETRTPDLYRVNFEVATLNPFPYLAFPQLIDLKEQLENGLVLMAN
jgi:hypothetical protein